MIIKPMSQAEIYRQGKPVPGNLQEEMAFLFQCPYLFLGDCETLFEKTLLCYQKDPVACTAVGCLQVA